MASLSERGHMSWTTPPNNRKTADALIPGFFSNANNSPENWVLAFCKHVLRCSKWDLTFGVLKMSVGIKKKRFFAFSNSVFQVLSLSFCLYLFHKSNMNLTEIYSRKASEMIWQKMTYSKMKYGKCPRKIRYAAKMRQKYCLLISKFRPKNLDFRGKRVLAKM